jgi:hypothetical protein
MKPDIQTNMETRVTEITDQNTIFDMTIATVEEVLGATMTEDNVTHYKYIDSDNGWQIDVTLDESIFDGVVTVAINQQLAGGLARLATMTINSKRITHETLGNINTILDRTYIENIFTAVFTAVKTVEGDNNDSNA